jgi:flagellar hook-associated protein 3 FlgL
VANTKDFNGEYIFSGTKSTTPPFTQDPNNPGAYIYSGNSDQRHIQVGPNTSIAVGDSGNSVFGASTGPAPATVPAAGSVSNVFEAINQFVTTLTTNPVKGSAQSTLQATNAFTINGVTIPAMAVPASKLTATPPITDAVTQGTSVAAAINLLTGSTGVSAMADPTTGALTFTDSGGAAVSVTVGGDVSNTGLTLGDLASGDSGSAQSPLQATHAFTINGVTIPAMAAPTVTPPATDSVTQGTSVAAAINLLTGSTGVTATADPTTGAITLANKTGAAITVAGDITNTGLSVATTTSGNTLQASLSDVTKGANQILSMNAVVGSRLNILTTQSTINSGAVLNMQTTLSSVQNIDEAAAISALNMQSIALQASQQAYSLVNKLSLFNYMN